MPFNGHIRGKNSIRRKRPAWWNPEGVLQRLQAGEFVMAVCEAARADMQGAGIELSLRKLRADIAAWEESASWGPQLKAALAIWKKERGTGELVISKTWHDDFLSCMEVCDGNAERAAEMTGVSYGIVLAVLDKRNSKCYDPEFVEKFRVEELNRVGRLRELYMKTAEGEGKLAMRAQEQILANALPVLHGQQKEVHVTGEVAHAHDHDHKHQHLHTLAPDIAREVVIASQNRVRRLGAGRERELPVASVHDEGRVIDVTPVIERSRA